MISHLLNFKQVVYLSIVLLLLSIFSALLTLIGWICGSNIIEGNKACNVFLTDNADIFLWLGVSIGVFISIAGLLTGFYYFNKN